jgi:hypothetical protein
MGNMQLPEFISKALAFFQKAEANLTAEQELVKAKARVIELEAGASASTAKVTELQGQLTIANTTITAKDTEITTLKAEVEKEKKRANGVIAGQGIAADAVPEAKADAGGAGTETAWATYNRLLASDPRAAGEYYMANAAKILSRK